MAKERDFDGETFESGVDGGRLLRQIDAIRTLMVDGEWRTLEEISERTGAPAASVSAQLRNLRKLKFGGYTVERRTRGDRATGLYEYKLVPIIGAKPRTRRQINARRWLDALMALVNAAHAKGVTIDAAIYELETHLSEQA